MSKLDYIAVKARALGGKCIGKKNKVIERAFIERCFCVKCIIVCVD